MYTRFFCKKALYKKLALQVGGDIIDFFAQTFGVPGLIMLVIHVNDENALKTQNN